MCHEMIRKQFKVVAVYTNLNGVCRDSGTNTGGIVFPMALIRQKTTSRSANTISPIL